MPAEIENTGTVLVGLLSQVDERDNLKALTIVRQLSSKCTIVLVDDQTASDTARPQQTKPISLRRKRVLEGYAADLDLDLDVLVRETKQGLAELSARSADDIFILIQPLSALDRQTLVFRQLYRALSAMPNHVLYAPAGVSFSHQKVIIFSSHPDAIHSSLAKRFAGPNGIVEKLDLEKLSEIDLPQSKLRLDIQMRGPSMIVVDATAEDDLKAHFSRLAATLSTPILVATHRDS